MIKVYFIKVKNRDDNSAAFNRFCALVKMVKNNFPYEILLINQSSWIEIGVLRKVYNRILSGIQVIVSLLNIPSSNLVEKNIVFCYSTRTSFYILCKIISSIKRNKFVVERNEFPSMIRTNVKWKVFLFNYFIGWWKYKLPDGMFLMTDELINFYSKYNRKDCILQKLPMTVDFERFKINKFDVGNPYIAYTGNLSNKKDGILYIINAFNEVIKTYSPLKLIIAGGTEAQIANLKDYTYKLGIRDRIEFLGLINRERIPGLLINATILVLPRPDSIQARGGFPTKLGEYLATKNPVIVTNVGEIPKYLSKKEVFFINKNNIEMELKETILAILDNPKNAMHVAENAFKKAQELFSIEANSNKIKKMLTDII